MVDNVRQAMDRLTRAVAAGQEPPERLVAALNTAIAETESLAHQLQDDTFAGDEVSNEWRAAALADVEEFYLSLYTMMGAVRPELRPDALLEALDRALAAHDRIAEGYLKVQSSYAQVREAMQAASEVPCVRCGHRNAAGRSTCESCRMQLPQIGVERVETDIIGGEEVATSAFVTQLEQLIQGLEQPEGAAATRDFLKKLEQVQLLATRQLDALLARVQPDHEAVGYTLELRNRLEGVRGMLEAVRRSLDNGDLEPLCSLPAWLANEFSVMNDLKNAIQEAAG